MSWIARIAETVHLLVVGLWLGSLVMGAVVAAIIFPTMRELDPSFSIFSAFTGNHADLGAGFIQARVFYAVDLVQFVGAFVGGVTLALSIALRRVWNRPSSLIRSVVFACAVLMFSYQFFVFAPRMDENARAYWQAAEAGDNQAAIEAKDAFSADHPVATQTFGFIGFFVFGSFIVGVWSLLPAGTTRKGTATPEPTEPKVKS
jgi:hypothetical protein